MANFSFNKPAGACPTCTGLGMVRQVVISRMLDEEKSIPENGIVWWDEFHINYYTQILQNASLYYDLDLDINKPIKDFTQEAQRDLVALWNTKSEVYEAFPEQETPENQQPGKF